MYIHKYIYTHIFSNNPYINNSFNSENSDDNNNNSQRHYDANDYNQYQLSQDTHVISPTTRGVVNDNRNKQRRSNMGISVSGGIIIIVIQ